MNQLNKELFLFDVMAIDVYFDCDIADDFLCGLHADWTELISCVDQELDKNEGETAKRRYFYITLLREPVVRYLSEFRHVQRGATWKTARHWCLGRQATSTELPPCYSGKNISYIFKRTECLCIYFMYDE